MGSGAAPGAPPAADASARRAVAEAFAIPGRFVSAEPLRRGWINETLLVTFEQAGRPVRYVQQRINRAVFRDPAAVMENVARVVAHQRAALEREGAGELDRRVLGLVPTRAGAPCHVDAAGETWRTWRFVEGATSRDVARGPADARAAAEAFARFQRHVADLPGPRLHETIPRYQDARARFEQLLAALRADAAGRRGECREELAFALARETWVDRLNDLRAAGRLPERVTHGDTKINNVLFDEASGEALCVIDLDTVMPGLAVYDFGDLVRTASCPTREDERDLSRVRCDLPTFEALVDGWLAGTFGPRPAGPVAPEPVGTAGLMPAGAIGLMPAGAMGLMAFAARLVTFVIGLRFLADHLAGDVYFRCERPGHNLDRARVQLRLAADMEAQAGRMEAIVAAAAERAEAGR